MPRINFSYSLVGAVDHKSGLTNELITYLSAIDEARSMVKAAAKLGLSYRTLWGKIEHYEKELNQKVVERDQGKAAKLTDLGKKLLWAERTVQARNALLIESLRSEFESVFARACETKARLFTVSGCFDSWLAKLPAALAASGTEQPVLDLVFQTSREGLERLRDDRCDIACFNLPANCRKGSAFAQAFAPLIDPDDIDGVLFTVRTQGLAAAPGNPLKLCSVIDVARRGARYANRKASSGTGLLLDEMLSQSGLKPSDINGYDRIEPSHMAVATAIASGTADAGICEENAARKLGLGFTPLVLENFYLAWKKSRITSKEDAAAISNLKKFLQSDEWRASGREFFGYRTDICGSDFNARDEWKWFD